MAVRAADPGEAGARIAAVEIALDDLPDDRPEMTVLLLEAALVGCQESVEVMEQHPIEDRALRMARTIDSRHIGATDSRSVPRLPRGRIGAGREIGQRPATLMSNVAQGLIRGKRGVPEKIRTSDLWIRRTPCGVSN
jgi:hypothetical protein